MIPSAETQKRVVKITGNPDSYFNGTVYVPNAPVTYGGNSSVGPHLRLLPGHSIRRYIFRQHKT